MVVSDCGTSDHKSDRPKHHIYEKFQLSRIEFDGAPPSQPAPVSISIILRRRLLLSESNHKCNSVHVHVAFPLSSSWPIPSSTNQSSSAYFVHSRHWPFFRSKIGHSRSESLSKFGNTLSATTERERKAQKPWLFPLRHEARMSLVPPPRSWSTSWTITT